MLENKKKSKILFNVRNGDLWNFVFSLKLVQESTPLIEEGKSMKNIYIAS